MSRQYIVQNWNNSATYSGEQIGSRLANSEQIHFLPNGQANIGLYEDDSCFQKELKLLGNVEDKLDKLDELELKLHKQFVDGKVSADDLERHLITLIKKRDRFFKDTPEQRKIAQLTKQYETAKTENKKTLDIISKMEENLRQQEQSNKISFVDFIAQYPWIVLVAVFGIAKMF